MAERQAQDRAVKVAEMFAQMFGPDDDRIHDDQVEAFLFRVLSESGFDLPDPRVAIDLDQEDVLAEVLEPGASEALADGLQLHGLTRDGVIHLHPERLSRWTLLHELAHYIAPSASHGPVWCRVYVDLVSEEFGAELGDSSFPSCAKRRQRRRTSWGERVAVGWDRGHRTPAPQRSANFEPKLWALDAPANDAWLTANTDQALAESSSASSPGSGATASCSAATHSVSSHRNVSPSRNRTRTASMPRSVPRLRVSMAW